MVTAVQVKKYLQPLIDANNDLALVGRLLVVKPVTHILRGVIIDRRTSAETIVPVWFCYHMFGPYPVYFLSWGDRLWGRNYRTDDPDVSPALCAEIDHVALPKIRPVVTIADFHQSLSVLSARYGHLWAKMPETKMLFDIAEGDLTSARSLAKDQVLQWPRPGPKDAPVTRAKWDGTEKLCALLAKDDIAGLVQTLHEWEAANIKALKLAPYWQPSPFPIEEKLGLAARR